MNILYEGSKLKALYGALFMFFILIYINILICIDQIRHYFNILVKTIFFIGFVLVNIS